MIDKQRLEEKCSTWNIALTGTQLDQLDAFAQILVDYNQKVNLTAITDPEGRRLWGNVMSRNMSIRWALIFLCWISGAA